jgi:putative membrane protein insertion efficiency factor
MGRCDSSTQHGGHGAICAAGVGAVEAATPRLAERVKRSVGAWSLLFLVRVYITFLSPFFGGACRFYPSCSNYAYEAIERHGAVRGATLAIKRLLRCHPFSKSGFDPVPDVLYREDELRGVNSSAVSGAQISVASRTYAHRPTKAVVAETWSAAGALGVERRL